MLNRLTGRRCSPIGVEFDRSTVRAIQLQSSAHRDMQFVMASSQIESTVALEADHWKEAAAEALRATISQGTFEGREVVSCLRFEQISLLRLRFPWIADSDVDSAVHAQAARKLGCSADTIRTDYYDVGEFRENGQRYREIISVAANTDDLLAHVELVDEVGLSLKVVDTGPGAVTRITNLGLNHRWRNANRFILYFSAEQPILLYVRNGEPCFVRALHARLPGPASRALSGVMDEPKAEGSASPHLEEFVGAAGHEIGLCLQYLSEWGWLDEWNELGFIGGPLSTRIAELLHHNTGVSFRPLQQSMDPAILEWFDNVYGDLSSWLVPGGLALHGMEAMVTGERAA